MPKRACPFGEYFPNQMKIHVGLKEIAQGVNKEKHMKDIYDKTLAMMFASQRQPSKVKMNTTAETPGNITNGHHPANGGMLGVAAGGCHDNGRSSSQMELLPGQCLLDVHGRIMAGHTVRPKPKESERCTTPRCQSCRKPTVPVVACCNACQCSLCTDCTRLCLQCQNGFCSMCSVVNYDENFDRMFCLSCSSQLK